MTEFIRQEFLRYPHLEKLGNREVDNIEIGTTYVFPKIDGTNASVWWDGEKVCCGSRNRQLSLEKDNAGFMIYVKTHENLCSFVEIYYDYILYGEWLVPHTLKTYREDAWNKFYIFDVYSRSQDKFLPYEVYQPLLEAFGLEYIPCIKKIVNGKAEHFLHEANTTNYLLPTGVKGEGVVIKNYEWKNEFGQQPWAKIVLSEFKDEMSKQWDPATHEVKSSESALADLCCTQALIQKEKAKIELNEGGWNNKLIPRLMETVVHSVITEELYNGLKKIKNPIIDFRYFRQLIGQKVRTELGL